MKYIDAEKLKWYLAELKKAACLNHADKYWLVPKTLTKIEQYTDSLQQESEVEFEKEIIRYQREDMDRDTTVADVARHFYELGINARKEE